MRITDLFTRHIGLVAMAAAAAPLAFMLCAAVLILSPSPAKANPAMARMTGEGCTTCHVPAQEPRLNQAGRAFKDCGYRFCGSGAGSPFNGSGEDHRSSYGHGAIAVGSAGREGHSGISFKQASQASADQRALTLCGDRASNCHVVARYASGACGYVTVAKPGQGTCWGVGSNPAEARLRCEVGGCQCKEPIGSCNR